MTRPAADLVNRDPASPVARTRQADDDGHERHPWAIRVGLLVTAIFVVLDQATKELAEALLEPGRFVPLLGERVGWQLVYNPGGAFGFPAPSWVFLVVTVLVLVIVVRALPRTTTLVQATAYGLLLAGALGNVLDRLFRPGDPDGWPFGDGHVVDFVAWGTFPRFNVADSAITVGFVLLVFALWREERAYAADQPPAEDTSEERGSVTGEGAAAGLGGGDDLDADGRGGAGDPDADGRGGADDLASNAREGAEDPDVDGVDRTSDDDRRPGTEQ